MRSETGAKINGHGLILVAFGGLMALLYATARLVPVPEAGFVIQCVVLGGAVGTLFALIRERRYPEVDIARATAIGGSAGLIAGLILVFVVTLIEHVT